MEFIMPLQQGNNSFHISNTFEPVKAAKLTEPIFDPTTKSEEHDMPINGDEIVSSRLLLKKELDF